MKRLWCWTIALLALFALQAMPPARAAVGDVNILKKQIMSGIWVKGMARWGDGLYMNPDLNTPIENPEYEATAICARAFSPDL